MKFAYIETNNGVKLTIIRAYSDLIIRKLRGDDWQWGRGWG